MAGLTVVSEGATAILARNRMRIARLLDMRPEMEAAALVVQEHTRQWYDSTGEGSWPALAESTVQRKASQGMSDPGRALYAEGNLYESVTSSSGPYSFTHQPDNHSIVIGVDWDENGFQVPVVLHGGVEDAGASHDVHIPARPIWPAHTSTEYDRLRIEVRQIMFRGL